MIFSNKNEIEKAINLCIILNEEMLELMSYADDSNCNIGAVVSSSVELIKDACELIDNKSELAPKCSELLRNHANSGILDGFDWEDEILEASNLRSE